MPFFLSDVFPYLMRILEERILPIRLISKSHLVPQRGLLLFTHPRQRLRVLLVQSVIIIPQEKYNEAKR